MSFRHLATATSVVALAACVVACGGGSSAQHHTRTSGSSSSTSGSSSTAVKFSQCMRQNGLSNFPDVVPGQGLPIQHEFDGSVDILVNGVPQPVSSPKLNSAMSACRQYMQQYLGHVVSGATANGIQHALVQTAACMREHGVPKYPDPPALGAAAGEHMSPTGQARSAGIDVNSPAFKSAVAKCGSIMANALNGK